MELKESYLTEIFYERELLEEYQNDELKEKRKELVDNLELVGQKSFIAGNKAVIPYYKLDGKMYRIIRILCPDSQYYDKYSYSPIPIRVLEELNRCKENNWFEEIKIYYNRGTKDPFVLGKVEKYSDSNYLIARWGDELLDFKTLEKMAYDKLTSRIKNQVDTLSVDSIVYDHIENGVGFYFSYES